MSQTEYPYQVIADDPWVARVDIHGEYDPKTGVLEVWPGSSILKQPLRSDPNPHPPISYTAAVRDMVEMVRKDGYRHFGTSRRIWFESLAAMGEFFRDTEAMRRRMLIGYHPDRTGHK